jgi:hypothetical protein
MAQDIPSSMVIGSVNVKITDEARTKIQNEISLSPSIQTI